MKSKKQNVVKRSKVSLGHKIIIFTLLCVFFCTIISFAPIKIQSITTSGLDVTYEVDINKPPDAAINITATYKNITSPLRLEIGCENWPGNTLSMLKDIQFSSTNGEIVSWNKIDDRTIEVSTADNSVIANYSIDLSKEVHKRPIRLEEIGGTINGFGAFLLPTSQKASGIKMKFIIPESWVVVSVYPKEGEWFVVKPLTREDLSLETQVSSWYFGVIDFDYTKTYDDGFEIRVVGFKYFEYEHWNVYLDNTPLEEALKCADFYHETYVKLKDLYGEFPLPKLLLIGSGFWQGGESLVTQNILGWNRYEAIPHHMLLAYFFIPPVGRISFNVYLSVGYATYCEGIMAANITNDPVWRGMVYERKIQYIRAKKFDNLEYNWGKSYVTGFISIFLMDREIKKQTNNQKGIHDLMVRIWEKYNGPDPVWVTDEQILTTLKEITGNDWRSFYEKNIQDTSNLDTDPLDELKDDFRLFLKAIADYWYNGSQSAYFITQELVSAAGNFDSNARMQFPMLDSPNIGDFVLSARKYKDITQSDLTEEDIEEILHQITGKNHSDFFEFYRDLGFNVDPEEITEFAKTFTYSGQMADNAIKLTPNTFPIGQSTTVVGEIIDPDFAEAKELGLEVFMYDVPKGLLNPEDIISGKKVFFDRKDNLQSGGHFNTPCTRWNFRLPIIKIGDKTYTSFKINLPDDAGVMAFAFDAKIQDKLSDSDFIGIKKVFLQSLSTFRFKPENFKVIDDTPPIFSITNPLNSEITTDQNRLNIEGLVEPDATILVNGQPATISDTSFEFSSYVDLIPGDNTIEVGVSDKAGNTVTKTISVTYKKTDTAPPKIEINSPADNSAVDTNTIHISGMAIDDESGIDKVTVNGSEVSVASNGSFSKTVNLTEGINTITIIALDKEGNTATKTITVTYTLPAQETIITLQPDNSYMNVNGVSQEIDLGRGTKPVIIPEWSRTVVPIRAIVEALGGTISWDGTERKVTINFKGTVIELWIDNPKARVNGTEVYIDPDNHNVKPIIVNDRTMLPLRFVTENLGCDVDWDNDTRTITITYDG